MGSGLPTPVILSFFITIAYAATDFAECCTRVPVPDDIKPYQWDACHSTYNGSEISPLKRFAPPILTTLQWCQQNCQSEGLFHISETEQWLTPFVSWVIPAATMLFLCPTYEQLLLPTSPRPSWREWLDEFVFNWLDAVIEYVQILGDPASAFNGALTQMMNDVTLVACLKRPMNTHREQTLIITAILAEQVDIELPIVRTTFQILAGLDKAREYSRTACRTMVAARKKFHMAVTLPVVFYIGVAAAIFYDAYGKLGDKDTAHSLAYGIWYNWILLLSIFSNCCASHMSLEAVRSSLEVVLRGVIENHTWSDVEGMGWDRSLGPARPLYEHAAQALLSQPLPSPNLDALKGSRAFNFQGTIEVRSLGLPDRYFNSMKWNKWLFDRGCDVCRPVRGVLRFNPFWKNYWERPHPKIRYAACQMLAWTFVLFPCLCAAFVSYTTPKVALGCRSANHLLYAAFALLVALVRVPKCFVDPTKRPRMRRFVEVVYHILVWFNAVGVLIGGTVLQLVGVYRTCWCAAGFFDNGPESIINMGTNTFEDQYWAGAVWLNIGFLSFGWIVVVAVFALAVRLYISYAVRDVLDI